MAFGLMLTVLLTIRLLSIFLAILLGLPTTADVGEEVEIGKQNEEGHSVGNDDLEISGDDILGDDAAVLTFGTMGG